MYLNKLEGSFGFIFHENLCEILNGLWIIGFHELSMRQSLMDVFILLIETFQNPTIRSK